MKRTSGIFRTFMLILLVSILNLSGCRQQKTDTFRFVFMTDIHVQPELNGDQGFKAAIDKVNALNPDFVITGGDLIMDALGEPYERSIRLYELYKNISANIQAPVYNTIGNHEVFGLYEKSGISPDHPQYGKKMYENQLGEGKTYRSFDHKGWHFMLLDAIGFTGDRRYYGVIDSLQMEWINDDLEKVDVNTPIAVSLHIPLTSVYAQMKYSATTPLDEGSVVTNAREVLALFKNHNLKLVLQGHLHIVEEIVYKDTRFITGGAVSGAWWTGSRDGFPEGFVVVDVEDNTFNWTYETFGWKAEKNKE